MSKCFALDRDAEAVNQRVSRRGTSQVGVSVIGIAKNNSSLPPPGQLVLCVPHSSHDASLQLVVVFGSVPHLGRICFSIVVSYFHSHLDFGVFCWFTIQFSLPPTWCQSRRGPSAARAGRAPSRSPTPPLRCRA